MSKDAAVFLWCGGGLVTHIYMWGFWMHALTTKGPGWILFLLTVPHSMVLGPLMVPLYLFIAWLMGPFPS